MVTGRNTSFIMLHIVVYNAAFTDAQSTKMGRYADFITSAIKTSLVFIILAIFVSLQLLRLCQHYSIMQSIPRSQDQDKCHRISTGHSQ